MEIDSRAARKYSGRFIQIKMKSLIWNIGIWITWKTFPSNSRPRAASYTQPSPLLSSHWPSRIWILNSWLFKEWYNLANTNRSNSFSNKNWIMSKLTTSRWIRRETISTASTAKSCKTPRSNFKILIQVSMGSRIVTISSNSLIIALRLRHAINSMLWVILKRRTTTRPSATKYKCW